MIDSSVTLEERLQRLEDLEAIRRLFLDYGQYLDTKDFRSCSELFADDGEFVVPFGVVKGPEGVRTMMEDMLGRDLAARPGKDLHLFANPTIELAGDRATARSFWIYVCPDADGSPRIAQFGHYEDEVVRVNGGWKFKRRDAQRDIGIPGTGVEEADKYAAGG
jgi:ketosteroid isomerase-like protein